jgi:hypothetical protein
MVLMPWERSVCGGDFEEPGEAVKLQMGSACAERQLAYGNIWLRYYTY